MEAPNLLLRAGECGKMSLLCSPASSCPLTNTQQGPMDSSQISVSHLPSQTCVFVGWRPELGCTGNLKPRG